MSEESNPSPKGEKGVVGLQNMGNTCYANSTLQILRAVPEWSAFSLATDFEKVFDTLEKKKINMQKFCWRIKIF